MFETALLICVIGYIAFRNWLQHDKRRMIHRERMAAIEKGIELPALEKEVDRKTWNVQRFLLLAGWSWLFAGIAGFLSMTILFSNPTPIEGVIPTGFRYLAIIPFGIGIAHLITFWSGERRHQRPEHRIN